MRTCQEILQEVFDSIGGGGRTVTFTDADIEELKEVLDACEEPATAQDEQYPPCDYCGVIPDHHPWHGSGMFNGEDSPHIHACNDCRHLLPTRPAQKVNKVDTPEQQPVAWGAFHFGGRRGGKLYTHCETEEQIESYIADLHRSNDSITLRKGPLYAAPIAQTAPDSDMRDNYLDLLHEVLDAKEVMRASGIEQGSFGAMFKQLAKQTAPQPEQSGLVEALEKYADDRNWCFDTCKIDRDIAKDALAAYYEALSAKVTSK